MFSSAPPHVRKDIGHTLNNIMLDCTFYGQECDSNFTLLQSPKYFNCYTFQNSHLKISSVGIENGLSLILKGEEISITNAYHMMSNTENTKSLRVAIHEPYTVPNLLDSSLELVPGYSTSVALSQQTVERLDTVNSKCSPESWFDHGLNKESHIFEGIKETFFTCVQNNIIKLVISKCKCIPAIMPIYSEQTSEYSNYPYCLQKDISDINDTIARVMCETEVLEEIQRGMEFPCVWNCKEIKYPSEISYSKWPLETAVTDFLDRFVVRNPNSSVYLYLKILRQKYNGSVNNSYDPDKVFTYLDGVDLAFKLYDSNIDANKRSTDFSKILENKTFMPSIKLSHVSLQTIAEAEERWVTETFYRLNVYFKDPTVEVHRQVLNYSPADLWSGVGGCVGLWIGCSIITMVEILEFMSQIIQIGVLRASRIFKHGQQNVKIRVKPV